MPTFTTIALENLLEPRNSGKNSSTLKNTQPSANKHKVLQNDHDETTKEEESKPGKRLNHIYISPALYTTPEPTPILDYSSSGSLSPSPYVFNRKGRGGGKLSNRRIDGFEVRENGGAEEELVESSLFAGGDESQNCLAVEDEEEDFVDPRCDSLSIASSSELNDSGRLGFENMSVVSNHAGEFYDAIEDFSSDGSISNVASCSRNIESELQATRLNLLEETEKHEAAEDNLAKICTHYQKVGKILLRAPSNGDGPMQFDIDEMKQLSQEVIVVRFVDEAIGKAEARAEAEVVAAVIIESKDKEISRLRDRLQYYEAMIHEMSQKNLESMEVARRQRERKRGQRKWLWSSIGMSVVIGASIIAYSYAPQPLPTVEDSQLEASYD